MNEMSISIPLLQSEEGCPKGGVVGKQEIPMNHINKELFSHLPPPPTGTPLPGGELG